MSLHFIEDIVEGAIRALVAHDRGEDVRDLVYALYKFQSGYDCGFTHGRVLPELVACRFAYVVSVKDHPRYAEHKQAFDAAAKNTRDITLGSDILRTTEALSDEALVGLVGNEDGYVADGKLYCDAGSPLWKDLVARGLLVGRDAKAPKKKLPLLDVFLRAALAAKEANDRELVALIYALGPTILLAARFTRMVKKGEVLATSPFTGKPLEAKKTGPIRRDPTPEEAEAIPELAALREVVRKTKALKVKLHYDLIPPKNMRRPIETWWYAV